MEQDSVRMPTPPGRRARRTTPPRQPITVDRIVDAAIRVLDAEGLDAVTMRRVAQELGTGPASLYAHVSDKEELLELMLDRIAAEVPLPDRPDPENWQEQIKEMARASRRVWTAHRDIARASLAAVPTGPNLLRAAEAMLATLRAGGVPPKVAAAVVDTLGLYIDASSIEATLFQAKVGGGDADAYFQEWIGQVRAYFAALPPERYPTIISMIDELTGGDGEERFEFALDLFMRGVASYVAENSANASWKAT
ncbi:TetR/AcrR family transcriptional regulator [Actinomadura kijaniata]|uniref:TetR/AcrR family transcriptional regulator n=1 Tax=Actinomadura kijaniata TaxID=46161 RepID=UPI003F1A4244